jgi:hypothetical protein
MDDMTLGLEMAKIYEKRVTADVLRHWALVCWRERRDAWIGDVQEHLLRRIPQRLLARAAADVFWAAQERMGWDEFPDEDDEEAARFAAYGMAALRWWVAWTRGDFPGGDYSLAQCEAFLLADRPVTLQPSLF